MILGTVVAVETFNRIGASEAEAFWLDFLRSLTRRVLRVLRGMTLVISDGSTVATLLADALTAELISREVRLLIVDPFVKSYRLEEYRNEQVDFAATLWSRFGRMRCPRVVSRR